VCRFLGARTFHRGLSAFGLDVVVDEGESDPTTMAQICELLGDCRRCKLHDGRKNIVFGVGPDADVPLLVVGEGPGEHEDAQGEPFVGKAGEMLDKMLQHVLHLRRDQVYITNVVRCRTPKNRDPESDEVSSCIPFLDMQKKVLRPRFVLLLGAVAVHSVLGVTGGIRANRGKWFDWEGTPTIATYHPAYLLRKPEDKAKALEDLRMLEARLRDA